VPPIDDVISVDTLIRDPKYPVYFTVGTGGIDLDGWAKGERPLWSAHRERVHGFLKVEKFTTSKLFPPLIGFFKRLLHRVI
jgi:hypothetical protein